MYSPKRPSDHLHPSGWRRVRPDTPCPVCGKGDWCLRSADGTAAICARTESARRCGDAGWLHRLQERPWQPERRRVRHVPLAPAGRGPDLTRLAAQCREAVDPVRLEQFAAALGLSGTALCRLGIGWSSEHRAWSFPMTDPEGNVLGVRLRRPGGAKFAVRGGKEGLFIPSDMLPSSAEALFVCEGPTDTAALLDLGYPAVVGRPSCTGGIRLLVALMRTRQPAEVVIVADCDEPGRRGADNLASVLVAYTPAVRVITPPAGIKDARAWLQAGATRDDMNQAIELATARRLVTLRVEKGR
jgi:hypothetical protein